eukprot:TRINITY_DN24205_c0_g3_i1.p1 TRINITY_DN24205_c0_g3~~TRINITY_DN24205_c0_g3_i1.p1  ORF type:complete len:856 (-),score=177.60 TRINITY_DN24205_c0_g3_i1:134-2701(-)
MANASSPTTTMLAMVEQAPAICEHGGHAIGLFMPRAYEADWDKGLRAFIYLIFLLWCFFGVMVVSDVFMAAIEKITSAKKRVLNSETKRFKTVLIWNPTIANLSLMALGSSAPEILLSVIEIISGNFFAGELGPSTIVGSAAFNLFCIIAVCIVAIPEGEVRYIKETQVYVVTASFSIFAYLWLIIILVLSSPDIVEIWEGVLTFLFFPILLIIAWMADRGMFPGTQPLDHSAQIQGMSKEELAERRAALQKEYGDGITEEQIVKLLQVESQAKNYASNKIAARRGLMGGKRPAPVKKPTGLQRAVTAAMTFGTKKVVPMDDDDKDEANGSPSDQQACIEFKMIKTAVLESAGHVDVVVCRDGAIDHAVTVHYETVEGSAKEASDYDRTEGSLRFEKGEQEKIISVKIIDDVAFEEDEEFYITLSDPKVVEGNEPNKQGIECRLGAVQKITVVIIDDDMPGVMSFEKNELTIAEPEKDTTVDITAIRKNGSAGKIGCRWRTENGTAVAGVDYEEASGTLEFDEGEMTKALKVTVKAKGRYDRTEHFRIILEEAVAPGKFDEKADGGPECCILTVFIETDKASKQQVDRIMSTLQSSWDKSKVGHANWAEQFKNAFYVMGGEDDDGEEDEDMKPGVSDWVFHIITLPWKICFALIPPTDYCGGWLCFFCALVMIGLLTGLIGDLAALFGCCANMKKEVAAITVVALGTSLPDTFASKAAAVMDKHADNSVGNVTGSNSVNVFLGLGLPWMMASLYWTFNKRSDQWVATYYTSRHEPFYNTDLCQNGCFVVKAGSLVFSVTVFTIGAMIAILLLVLRRKFCGGELGGPRPQAIASSILLVCLWLLYISLSWWYVETQ